MPEVESAAGADVRNSDFFEQAANIGLTFAVRPEAPGKRVAAEGGFLQEFNASGYVALVALQLVSPY